MTLPLSIWTTGRPVPEAERLRGSFFEMIRSAVAPIWRGGIQDIDCESGAELPTPDEVAGVIVTGSPARILDRDPWMLEVEAALRRFETSKVPVLGICFGHQLMGMALGGAAAPNPRGREIGTYVLDHHEADELIRPAEEAERRSHGLPDLGRHVVMTHLDSVVELPPRARRLASTERESNAAIRFSDKMWGVQFHPEMDVEIIGHYLDARRADIEREGLDVEGIKAAGVDSSYGLALLRRFAQFCLSDLETRR